MITRMGIVRKKDSFTPEQFVKHWKEVHGPIVADMTHIRRYHQNLVVNNSQLGIGFATRSNIIADGFSELWYDDFYEMNEGMASQGAAAKADLAIFTEPAVVVTMFKRVVVPVPGDWNKPFIKRITFLKRNPAVSPEDFQWEWLGPHAEMVKTMPNVIGYNQNVIIDRMVGGKSIPYADFPFDGVVEFWFENVAKLEESFASPEYAVTSAHGKTFLDTMTTFLVEPIVIVK